MRAINKGVKRAHPVSLEQQVAYILRNCAKIVITNRINDKSTTVEKDIQFRIPPAKVRL